MSIYAITLPEYARAQPLRETWPLLKDDPARTTNVDIIAEMARLVEHVFHNGDPELGQPFSISDRAIAKQAVSLFEDLQTCETPAVPVEHVIPSFQRLAVKICDAYYAPKSSALNEQLKAALLDHHQFDRIYQRLLLNAPHNKAACDRLREEFYGIAIAPAEGNIYQFKNAQAARSFRAAIKGYAAKSFSDNSADIVKTLGYPPCLQTRSERVARLRAQIMHLSSAEKALNCVITRVGSAFSVYQADKKLLSFVNTQPR